jgi:hypothetical protein
VLGSRATVLLVSDGLEHEAADDLAFEMERLHKSCRRLVWLNPLLRFEAFQPKARGMAQDPRVMMHFYDAALHVQMRVAGRATLHLDDAVADAAWEGSQRSSRMCYAAPDASGAIVQAPPAAPKDTEIGRPHFAAVVIGFHRLEWLWLAAAGHQRARFIWDEAGNLTADWIAP